MTTPITIEEIRETIKRLQKMLVTPVLDCHEVEQVIFIVAKLRDALVSGEYALVSKADREEAIALLAESKANEKKLRKALQECCRCLNEELQAAGSDDHPTIKDHRKVLAKAVKLLL